MTSHPIRYTGTHAIRKAREGHVLYFRLTLPSGGFAAWRRLTATERDERITAWDAASPEGRQNAAEQYGVTGVGER